jgi:biotin carboxyl carrier protein
MSEIISSVLGFIAKINVKVGDQINSGDVIALVQCMKTEISVLADKSGVVSEIKMQEGDEIDVDDVILVLA